MQLPTLSALFGLVLAACGVPPGEAALDATAGDATDAGDGGEPEGGALPDAARVDDRDSGGVNDGGDAGAVTDATLPSAPTVPRAGAMENVWVPGGGRYVNEPTLIRAPDGVWHLFANGDTGAGGPWGELQMIHATAPALHGPWRDEPDVLRTSDPGAHESSIHAPFVQAVPGGGYQLYYYDGREPAGRGLHVATSMDLYHWTREPDPRPGGRDPAILRMPDGRDLLYTVHVLDEAGSLHDAVSLFEGRGLTDWQPREYAVRNPTPCPESCWGWYESPFPYAHRGSYFLLVTYTSSLPGRDDYERTAVFRSETPTRFPEVPLTQLRAHGGEIHEEDGRLYLTSGGWPSGLGGGRRGLFVAPLEFVPE